MSSYQIQPYTHLMAYKYGVRVVPSKNSNKKIDVLHYNENYICSIGDIKKCDYPTIFKTRGAKYAEKRRDLYHIRHTKHSIVLYSKSYYVSRLLW